MSYASTSKLVYAAQSSAGGLADIENIPPRGMQSPGRRPRASSGSGAGAPLRRVSTFAGQPTGRIVGLGLVEGSLIDSTGDEQTLVWPERASTPDSAEILTAPASPNLLSPYSPEAGPSATLIATDATLRSPRSSALLDPGAATQSGRRSSISHASHSSSGSASSFHSALSIRMDEPASTATSRNPSSNYWIDSPDAKYSPEEKVLNLPRTEKRPRSRFALRNLASGLITGLHAITATGSSDANGASKRPLPARLLTLAYVTFSLLYLTSRLLAPYTPFTSPVNLIRRQTDVPESSASAVPTQWSSRLSGPDDLSPLSAWHHPYRFSKMHSKLQGDAHEGLLPCVASVFLCCTSSTMHSFVYRASLTEGGGEVTACVYTNEAWLSELPEFVKRWNGPVSAVVEVIHERGSAGFEDLVSAIARLRDSEPAVKRHVDVHLIVAPPSSDAQARKIRTRLINAPIASNFHLNAARYFSRTQAVWLVGDPRVLPSHGLRKRLNSASLLDQVTKKADAIVVPTFAALRSEAEIGRLTSAANRLLEGASITASDDFSSMARRTIDAYRKSLPVPYDRWPKKKGALLTLSTSYPEADDAAPSQPAFALWDRSWEVNKGPANFQLWRRSPNDPLLSEGAEVGGGAGLGVGGRLGGGNELYKIAEYDLHYTPAVVVGRNQQPWCTERFGATRAACIYQMYLAGAEMWVVPDEWAFTIEPIERNSTSVHGLEKSVADAERLQDSIASRLYTKYHQEACMHYGREFLSLGQWGTKRADHLRATCARVLSSWGVGIAASD